MEVEKDQIIRDAKIALKSESGARLLKHLEMFSFMHHGQSAANLDNPNETYYNLGRQGFYKYIISLVNYELNDEHKDCTIEVQEGPQ